jgi:hypothetical protein
MLDLKSVPKTSCPAESIFVHFTVLPDEIETGSGLNEKSSILTSTIWPPVEFKGVTTVFAVKFVSAEVVAGVAVGVAEVPALLPVHPIAKNKLNKINKIISSLFILPSYKK